MNRAKTLILASLLIFAAHGIAAAQSASDEQRQHIKALVDEQVEAGLESNKALKEQTDALGRRLKLTMDLLNKRLHGAGLPDITDKQHQCLIFLASYSRAVVLRTMPAYRRLPAYLIKANSNLELTTAESEELNKIDADRDAASKQFDYWIAKRQEFADSYEKGENIIPVPGPALRKLHSEMFVNVNSNKYKFDFDRMEFVPKRPNEFLEKPDG